MDEKDFLEIILSERMGMHYDRFKKDCPPTEEQVAEAEKADQAHETLFSQLTPEQRECWKRMRTAQIRMLQGKTNITTVQGSRTG